MGGRGKAREFKPPRLAPRTTAGDEAAVPHHPPTAASTREATEVVADEQVAEAIVLPTAPTCDEIATQASDVMTNVPVAPTRAITVDDEDDAATTTNDSIESDGCHYTMCKKVLKPVGEVLIGCDNDGCRYFVHDACSGAMLTTFGDPAFDSTVCGKRCYNALVKSARTAEGDSSTKKRIPWHNDGSTPSISSLSYLLDWLTTDGNYLRYYGGDGQSGDTKVAVAGEVVRFTAECGVTTVRTAKDVMTKIYALQQSSKSATDWLAHIGQGVTDETSLRSAISARCQYYDELYPFMIRRASVKAKILNTDVGMQVSDDEGGNNEDERDEEATTVKRSSSTPLCIAAPASRKRKADAAATPPSLIQLKEAQFHHEQEMSRKNYECARQKMMLKRKTIELRERESGVRVAEVATRARKLSLESEQLEIQVRSALLRERQRLREDGIPQEEIDLVLPLTRVTASPAQLQQVRE